MRNDFAEGVLLGSVLSNIVWLVVITITQILGGA